MENNLPAEEKKENNRSKTYRTVAIAIGGVLLAILIFAGGVVVGLRKARFSYSFGQNYERNFVGMRESGRGGMMNEGPDFRDPHGLAGTIISISGNNLVVKDRSGQENTVTVTDKTLIKYQGNNLRPGDLKQNEQVVILGKPSGNGTVNADLIRVFDNLPPDGNNNPSNNNPAPQLNNNPGQPVVNSNNNQNNQPVNPNSNQPVQNNNQTNQ